MHDQQKNRAERIDVLSLYHVIVTKQEETLLRVEAESYFEVLEKAKEQVFSPENPEDISWEDTGDYRWSVIPL